jgi:Spy/CpxP family protein refolding chaperone
MTSIIRTAIVALALVGSVSAVSAMPSKGGSKGFFEQIGRIGG